MIITVLDAIEKDLPIVVEYIGEGNWSLLDPETGEELPRVYDAKGQKFQGWLYLND